MEAKHRHYKIDPEFRDLIPSLSPSEYEELERSILADGCREAIYIWRDYIIDGHNRYEICLKHNLEPPIFKKDFDSREEVIVWICSAQLSRRNVNESVRKYLIGKRYETEKIIGAHNADGCNQYHSEGSEVRHQSDTEPQYDQSVTRTRERIGKDYNIGSATVYRYGEYAKSIDKIRDISPTAAKKILNETALVNTKQLIAMTELPTKEVRKFCRRINESPDEIIPYSKTKAMISRYITGDTALKLPDTVGAIKQMPQYDADAEIKSLALTIPSWIHLIERVLDSPNTFKSSCTSRMRLADELTALQITTDKLLLTLEEIPTNG